uniref:peptidyl-tRNA hydrolase n=1 Tax=Riptortus pedestris TaxID=329032 RepID=R4WPT0_RIPPE|nr:unkown protein [Riptortus pedestris]
MEPNIGANTGGEDVKMDPPNPEYLKCLMEMGISQTTAEQALRTTNNSSLEAAASCALELHEVSDEENWEDIDENFKMVFVVNSSLKMGVGKIAAQVAHAAVDLYKLCLLNKAEECVKLACWQDSGEKKIVLSGKDELELIDLAKKALELNIPHYVVRDAGLTEVPENSLTVLGLFGTEEEVDKVTKHLRLL